VAESTGFIDAGILAVGLMAKTKRKSTSSKFSRKPSPVAGSGIPAYIAMDKNVWPIERDVLFRPDRLKYVRKLIHQADCVFCTASKEISFESLCVYQSKYSMVVVNKFPYNSGHLLVLPLKHKGQIFELSEQEFSDLHQTLRLAMKAITAEYQPGGINIGLNHGQAAGAGIPDHLHYHLIPRWAGDLNFFPLIAETKVVIENLEQTYERLQNFFQSYKGAL
jgi:ATP adenylyltransferase